MPGFARDFRNSNQLVLVERQLSPRWIKARTACWLLALFTIAVMLPLITSRGRGFITPKITQISTPAGNHHIPVVDYLVVLYKPL